MKTDILILVPTRMEIAPLLKISQTQSETKSEAGRIIIHAKYMEQNFKILITEPGIVNTAQALTEEIVMHRPGIVLQTGIAGIFRETGLQTGDIAVAESERYIHAGIEADRSSHDAINLAPLPFDLIAGDVLTRKGILPVDSEFSRVCFEILQNHFPAKKIRVIKGHFITVSTITSSKDTAKKFFSLFSPCMEAMEGSAAAHVAALYRIPFIEIRAGSNYVGQRDKSRWNISLAAKRASLATAIVIEKVSGILHENLIKPLVPYSSVSVKKTKK